MKSLKDILISAFVPNKRDSLWIKLDEEKGARVFSPQPYGWKEIFFRVSKEDVKEKVEEIVDWDFIRREEFEEALVSKADASDVETLFDGINTKIPEEASNTNKLADKNFVAASIEDAEQVFFAYYGTTPYNDVLQANASGKLVILKGLGQYDSYPLIFTFANPTCYFVSLRPQTSNTVHIATVAAGNVWNHTTFDIADLNTASLANYYLKSQTYTKEEVQALIAAINQFHYEVYPSLSSVTNPQGNVLYLIGPTGTGNDKYEEYIYSNGFTKIGDTSIDLSAYMPKSGGVFSGPVKFSEGLNADGNRVTDVALPIRDDDAANKEYVDRRLTTKQDTLISGTNIKTLNNESLLGSGNIDIKDIFIATYNVTPFDDVYAAFNAGKAVLCKYGTTIYRADNDEGGEIWFESVRSGAYVTISKVWVDYNNVWRFESARHIMTSTETESEISVAMSTKQDTLISGTNIKTINNQSLLGSGNIEIQGGGDTNNLFIAEYAVTRVSEIIDAYNAGKDIVAKKENGDGGYDFYQLLGYNDSVIQFDFYTIDDSTIRRIYIVDQGGETAEEEWGLGITTNLNKSDIFWATYNLTTLAQVQSAINSGKLVFVKVDGIALHCPGITSDVAVFTSFVLGYGYISVSLNSNGWEQVVLTNPEFQNNKVTSIGAASSDIQYPSAKAVYDALAGKAEPVPVESTTVTSGQNVTIASLTPNVLHKYTGAAIGNLTVSALATPSDETVYNEYMIEVELGASSVISFPSGLKWYGGTVPTIEAGVWQFSIVDGCIVAGMFNATS